MTKSSMLAPSNSIGPCTRSSKRIAPSGTRKRIGARTLLALARGDLVGGQRAAGAVVAPGAAGLLRRVALRFQLFRRAVAVVRAALRDEARRHRAIAIEPLGLKVRTVRAADLRALVPVETEPAQAVENALDHVRRRALDVGVLDAQDEDAAVPAREEPVEERGAGAADVQVAGGRRSEADADHRVIGFQSW